MKDVIAAIAVLLGTLLAVMLTLKGIEWMMGVM